MGSLRTKPDTGTIIEHNRLRGLCFCGTFSPSRLQILSTRSRLLAILIVAASPRSSCTHNDPTHSPARSPPLNNPPGSVGSSRSRRARYDERVKRPLVTLWTTANRICSKRLVPFLPELIEVMERKGHLDLPVDVRGKLLTISSASADRLLATERNNQRGVSTTRPGSLLEKQIKVRTFADWDDLQPGFLEVDLVAHCGYQSA